LILRGSHTNHEFAADERIGFFWREVPMTASSESGGGQADGAEACRLLSSEVRVINIGLRQFASNLEARNVAVINVDWSPPAVSDPKIRVLLAKLGG
jgi:hypothetical protein